ncbi:MAG: hypothetical protein JNK04_16905, partial [Myxococcales bacterium]|nr:hypothetical protein [Myxococcales bacterium]
MRARTAAAVSALAACASACNLLVGGDDLVFRDGGSGGGGGTTSGPGSGGGGGVGGGSSSVVGGGGSGEGGAPPSLVPVESIAAGRGTCAVLEGGRVRCWGRNDKGQLGLGHTDPVSIDAPPSADVTLPPGVVVEKVVVGLEHACALSSTQEVYCWGSGA